MLCCCRRSLRRRRDGIGTDAGPEKEGGRAGATRRDEAGRLAYQAGGPSTARGMGGRLSDRGGELQEQRRRTSLAMVSHSEGSHKVRVSPQEGEVNPYLENYHGTTARF